MFRPEILEDTGSVTKYGYKNFEKKTTELSSPPLS